MKPIFGSCHKTILVTNWIKAKIEKKIFLQKEMGVDNKFSIQMIRYLKHAVKSSSIKLYLKLTSLCYSVKIFRVFKVVSIVESWKIFFVFNWFFGSIFRFVYVTRLHHYKMLPTLLRTKEARPFDEEIDRFAIKDIDIIKEVGKFHYRILF